MIPTIGSPSSRNTVILARHLSELLEMTRSTDGDLGCSVIANAGGRYGSAMYGPMAAVDVRCTIELRMLPRFLIEPISCSYLDLMLTQYLATGLRASKCTDSPYIGVHNFVYLMR